MPCALGLGGEAAQLSLAAGAFARAAHAAAFVVGIARIKELLATAPEPHAGAIASRFALGLGDLPEGQRSGWKRLLEQTCAAHRRAPAAARRVGLTPPWPPNLPDSFAPMIREAEESNASVQSADAAAARPAEPKRTQGPGASAAAKEPQPARAPSGKTLAPPIRQSPFRRPIGAVVEVPATAPPKPMEPLAPLRTAREPELRFDARGRRVPRADRWSDEEFEWEAPVLPSSDLPPPPNARPAAGPFAARLQSLFEDRPEAVDRLCGAAEARAAAAGAEQLARELRAEISRPAWRERKLPDAQVQRLRAVVKDSAHAEAWRAAAQALLDFFVFGHP